MSREKKHRHDESHDHRREGEQAQTHEGGTAEHDASQAASAHQRRQTGKMVHDERFSEGLSAVDAEARIIAVSVSGGRTRITIAKGREEGVHPGMEGYIKKGEGMLDDFQIESTKEHLSFAAVDVTPDEIQSGGNLKVVINPTSKPQSSEPRHDMKSRVIGVSVVGGKTQIMIALGTRHGARWGMRGYLSDGSGKPFADFEIHEQHAGHSLAFVSETVDQVQAHLQVVLNPS